MRKGRQATAIFAIICLLLVMGAGGGIAGPDVPGHKVHPALLNLAKERPEEEVQVIVQLRRGSRMSDQELPAGARRQRDISFIDAQILTLPAQAALRIAQLSQVRYVSHNAAMGLTATHSPVTAYPYAVQLDTSLWPRGCTGSEVGVAVLDSGIADHPDFRSRVRVAVPGIDLGPGDSFGHGTHVAGIIAGSDPDGQYQGVAPLARLFDLKVSGDSGEFKEGDLLSSLEWIYYNHAAHGIRVVNISAQSALAQSYRTAPVAAAVEQLWSQGIVVVVSAGNRGSVADAMYYPPANDPYVITVGAFSDAGTADRSDDYIAGFSSRGMSQDGYVKPDLFAPGHRLVASLADGSYLGQRLPERVVATRYIRLSGTSMAAPVVAGVVADLLSCRRDLQPDQIKWLLTHLTAGSTVPGLLDAGRILAYLDQTPTSGVPAANLNLMPNDYLNPDSGAQVESNVFFENVFFENVFFENMFLD